MYEALAFRFRLTPADLALTVNEADRTPRSKWENIVRYAVWGLRKRAKLRKGTRGVWELRDHGGERSLRNDVDILASIHTVHGLHH